MATKRVKTKDFPDPIIIEEADFDPKIHKEVADELEPKEEEKKAEDKHKSGK